VNESRTKLLLAVLGVLVLFVAWHYLGPSGGMINTGPDAAGTAGTAGSPSTGGSEEDDPATATLGRIPGAGRPVKPPVEEILDLKVADLQPQKHEYQVGRDPWHFVDPPPPLPPPQPQPRPLTADELRAQREAEALLRQQQEEAARRAAEEAARPKPPVFSLKYLGRFGPADRPIAVFTDGNDILNVQQGEVIQGKFLLSQVGLESVEIRFVDFPNEPAQRLPIGR
jgi:hypothetical protein